MTMPLGMDPLGGLSLRLLVNHTLFPKRTGVDFRDG